MVPVFPLGVAALAVGGVVAGTEGGPFPGTSIQADQPRVERLYRDNDRIVGPATLDLQAAERACPGGHQVRRQETREDGSRVYLVWTLRCR